MKKIVALVLTLVLVLGLCLTASAELGSFVESPSNNSAPQLVGAKNEDEDCVARLIITAYADRDDLSEKNHKKLEEAYGIIIKTEDLSKLNKKVADAAKKSGAKVSDLAVSDMFDISSVGCDAHEDHGHFDIVLKADTLKNFVCLLHYYNGEWRVVEDAKVTQNGQHLEFTEEDFSPFAIVVNTAVEGTSPATQDNVNIVWYVAIMAVSAISLLIVFKKCKSAKAN